jgi:lipid-binding SYLF domain-containing protein
VGYIGRWDQPDRQSPDKDHGGYSDRSLSHNIEAGLYQVTVGFQWGGQAYSKIAFFKDEEAPDRLKSGQLELSAQASAVAVTAGAAATEAYEVGVAVFTLAKGGLMYEASIGWQKFTFDEGR